MTKQLKPSPGIIPLRRLRRPNRIFAALLVGSVLATGVTVQLQGRAATTQIFAPNSFWYQPIPSNAPRHPNSDAIVSEVVRQMKTYYGSSTRMNVKINTTDFAAPVYIAGPNEPRVDVDFYNCQNKNMAVDTISQKVANDYFKQVPIPAWAEPAAGTDKEMVVYSPSENRMWEFWVMEKANGRFRACWGGRMDNVSQNPGIWPHPYGTTAAGLPFMGGQITVEELKAGRIDHAIGMALPEPYLWSTVSWPANRSDGFSTNPAAPPEGLRFRLDPNLNVDALNIHPVAKTVAKAAQTYGIVIWDKAGAVSIRAENPTPFLLKGQPNPYTALYSPKADWNVLDGIPWDRLQAMPVDYGKNIASTPPPADPPPAPPAGPISQVGNLAAGKTFTSSGGAVSGFPVSNVNNGNEGDRWISGPADNVALSVDLGTAYDLNKVSILWAGDTTKDYDVQVSGDGSAWRTVATGRTGNIQKQLLEHGALPAGTSGRYVRILAKTRWNAAYGNSIWELGLYGAPTPPTGGPGPVPAAPGDLNGDGKVTITDLSVLLSQWGSVDAGADLNRDGTVGITDLSILLSKWTG